MLCRQMQILSCATSFAIVAVLPMIYAVLQGCFIWPWLVALNSVSSISKTSWAWLRAGKDPSLPWVIALLQVSSTPYKLHSGIHSLNRCLLLDRACTVPESLPV